jgi:uncharacterized protein YegP (UPF0339 family)
MAKGLITALHRRSTPFRKRESYWTTISSTNNKVLFTSEKYVNKADAIHGLQLVVMGVPDDMPAEEE